MQTTLAILAFVALYFFIGGLFGAMTNALIEAGTATGKITPSNAAAGCACVLAVVAWPVMGFMALGAFTYGAIRRRRKHASKADQDAGLDRPAV